MGTGKNGSVAASDHVSDLAERLKRDWSLLQEDQQTDGQIHAMERADLLARYHDEGMTQSEIGVCIGVSSACVDKLLRYNRFLHSTECKIPEGRFRAYWNQMRDPQVTRARGRNGADPAYEAKVFGAIVEWVTVGKKPIVRSRAKRPKVTADLKTDNDIRKEFNRRWRENLEPTVVRIVKLLGTDRSTYAPDILSGHAQVLRREMNAICRLFGVVVEGE